jgi:hypothetical protein
MTKPIIANPRSYMYSDVSSFRYVVQEKIYSLRRSKTTLPHPFYMTAVAALAEEVHFASGHGIDSPQSKNSAPLWTEIVEPPADDHSFL